MPLLSKPVTENPIVLRGISGHKRGRRGISNMSLRHRPGLEPIGERVIKRVRFNFIAGVGSNNQFPPTGPRPHHLLHHGYVIELVLKPSHVDHSRVDCTRPTCSYEGDGGGGGGGRVA